MFESLLRTKYKSFIHSHTPNGVIGLAWLQLLEQVKARILKGYLDAPIRRIP